MRNKIFLKFIFLTIVVSQVFLFGQIDKLEKISQKTKNMVSFLHERTVAIKIIVGDRTGFGSGAFISSDGLILTCAHVAEVSPELTVITHDGKQLQAERLGMNGLNDYAVIKINQKEPTPYFEMGSSEEVQLLDWVIGVGHPGGPYPDFKPAVAIGRVRGLNKKLPIQFGVKYYHNAIQTDVPIFAGNSGGPLVDLDGKLLGINGAITLANDLAFAAPIDEIKEDLPKLNNGVDVPGTSPDNLFQLFFELQEDFSPDDMKRLYENTPLGKFLRLLGSDPSEIPSIPPKFGATVEINRDGKLYISSLETNGTARLAGLQAGDRILAVNGNRMRNARQFRKYISKVGKGESLEFSIKRSGKNIKQSVVFDRKYYSRDQYMERGFANKGKAIHEATVKIVSDGAPVGYGAIIDDSGFVLTNNTIILDGTEVFVQLQTIGSPLYPCKVVGTNGVLDIALLKFETSLELNSLKIVDDAKTKIGDWVISGGSYDGIVKAGMVSALNRYVPSNRKIPNLAFGLLGPVNKSPVRAYDKVIHHDTNIHEDQFGTPLVNMKGELVGINAGHFYRGTTFAVPSSAILEAMADLKSGKHIPVPEDYKPYQPEEDALSKMFKRFLDPKKKDPTITDLLQDLMDGLQEEPEPVQKSGFLGIQPSQHWKGVKIEVVLEGYAAEKSGMKKGDIITQIGATRVHSVSDLLGILKGFSPGKNIEVTVLRNGEEVKIPVVLSERP